MVNSNLNLIKFTLPFCGRKVQKYQFERTLIEGQITSLCSTNKQIKFGQRTEIPQFQATHNFEKHVFKFRLTEETNPNKDTQRSNKIKVNLCN